MTLQETLSTDGETMFLFAPHSSALPHDVVRERYVDTWLTGSDYHPRPGYGKVGKVIKVEANMFQTRFKKAGTTIQCVCDQSL
jgi:hypothetical protein